MAVRNLDEMHITSRDALILDNMNLVHYITNRYKRYGELKKLEYGDLVSLGTIGLIKAIDNFRKKKRNSSFSTFAINSIHSEVSNFVKRKTDLIRIPDRISTIRKEIFQRGLEHLAPHQIADLLGKDVESIKDGLEFFDSKVIPFEVPSSTEDEAFDSSIFFFREDDLSILIVDEFLASLSEIQRLVVMGKLENRTREDIGQAVGVSKDHVYKILKRVSLLWERDYCRVKV